jgi:SAM-dependent methyltransferase
LSGPNYRPGSQARADQIAAHIDVQGALGLDLGCSVGGVSFGLLEAGADSMHGADLDATAIDLARRHADAYALPATFDVADLADDNQWLPLFDRSFDFVVWLANWMWVAKAAGMTTARDRLWELSRAVPVLAFETAQGHASSMAGTFGMRTDTDVVELLEANTIYTRIRCVGRVADSWHGRSLFIAER